MGILLSFYILVFTSVRHTGETGCGKSSLCNQLCHIIRRPLFTLNIHGGMEDADIIEWMHARIAQAKLYPTFVRFRLISY